MDEFLYTRGQTGRGVFVDSSGRLIANNDLSAGPFIYSFGDTGRPLSVDASGRLLINVSGSGVGEFNEGQNVGSGSGIYAGKTGVYLQFKSLIPGNNVTITGSGNTGLIIASSGGGGSIDDATNVGSSGIGVFVKKSGTTFQFKNIGSGSPKITVQDLDNTLLIDADESQFSLTNISGILPIAKGGTGASGVSDARTNLGLEIGVDVQAHDPGLDDIALLNPTAGTIITGDGSGWISGSGWGDFSRHGNITATVKNTGSQLYKGDPVRLKNGFDDGIPAVGPRVNIGGNTFGIVSSSGIAPNSSGAVTVFGSLTGFDTTGLTAGFVWASGTTLTNTQPFSAIHGKSEEPIAYVHVGNSANGSITVLGPTNEENNYEGISEIPLNTEGIADTDQIVMRDMFHGSFQIPATVKATMGDVKNYITSNLQNPSGSWGIGLKNITVMAYNVGISGAEGELVQYSDGSSEIMRVRTASNRNLGIAGMITEPGGIPNAASGRVTIMGFVDGVSFVDPGTGNSGMVYPSGSSSHLTFTQPTDVLDYGDAVPAIGYVHSKSQGKITLFPWTIQAYFKGLRFIGNLSEETSAIADDDWMIFRDVSEVFGIGETTRISVSGLRDYFNLDFVNSSGNFQAGIDTANQVRTDFDNSSGIFQAGTDTANDVRADFDNSSGIFQNSVDITTDLTTYGTLKAIVEMGGATSGDYGDIVRLAVGNGGAGVPEVEVRTGNEPAFGIITEQNGIGVGASGEVLIRGFATNLPMTGAGGAGGYFYPSGRHFAPAPVYYGSLHHSAMGYVHWVAGNNVVTVFGPTFSQEWLDDIGRLGSQSSFADDDELAVRDVSAAFGNGTTKKATTADLSTYFNIDFTNSSGIFQSGADARVDFDNSSGIFQNTTNSWNQFAVNGNVEIIAQGNNQVISSGDIVGAYGSQAAVGAIPGVTPHTDGDTHHFGVALEEIQVLASGRVLVQGLLKDVDTSAWTVGTTLYPSGGYFTTDRRHPNVVGRSVNPIGKVMRSDASDGLIYVFGPDGDYNIPSWRDFIELNAITGAVADDDKLLIIDQSAGFGDGTEQNVTAANLSTYMNTDFTNSSGIFQNGVDTADQVRTDFDNSSGIFQAGTDTADQVRTDFDNSSGVFQATTDSWDQFRIDGNVEVMALCALGVKGPVGSGDLLEAISTGSPNGMPIVAPASVNEVGAFGIALEDIAQGSTGRVLIQGIFTGLDTSSFLLGQRLYPSGTGFSNAEEDFTSNNGTYGRHVVAVTIVDDTNGSIYFYGPRDGQFVRDWQDFENLSSTAPVAASGDLMLIIDQDGYAGGPHESKIPLKTLSEFFNTDLVNASGNWTNDIGTNTTNITNLQTDFDNSSGVFAADISTNATNITNLQTDFTNASGNWIKDGENLGSGSGVFKQKDADANLEFRTIIAGSNIGINQSATELEIYSTAAGGGGETNTASNVGTGSNVFKQKVGVDLEFRSLTSGSGITLTQNTNDVEIKASVTDRTGASLIYPPSGEQKITLPRTDTEYTILRAQGYRRGGVNSGWDVLKNGTTIFSAGSIQDTSSADTWNSVSPSTTTISFSDTLQVIINASGLADEVAVSIDLETNN